MQVVLNAAQAKTLSRLAIITDPVRLEKHFFELAIIAFVAAASIIRTEDI